MAINLLALEPHKVSRDLSGYITYIYGGPGIGKTTFGSKMPKPLLLAAERGYNAIPGIIAQDILSWSDMRQTLRELKKPEVKEKFSSIIVDTADIMSDYCQKYICSQLGIENIGDGGWTNNGWSKYKKEFEDVFRTLAQLGYAIVFISHGKEKTIKPKFGDEYQQICPSLQSSAETILENMADLIGYAHVVMKDGVPHRVLTLRSSDDSIICKSRFSQIAPEIEFTYDALSKALTEAIDKEATAHGNAFITDAPVETVAPKTYNFTELMNKFNDLVGELMSKDQSNARRITAITDKALGKGKKAGDCTEDQCEQLDFIVSELQALLKE